MSEGKTMPDSLITLIDAARRLGITERQAGDLARNGQLAGAIKVGGAWRVNPTKLEAWIEADSTDVEDVRNAMKGGSNDAS